MKTDRLFLEKFTATSIYFKTTEEFIQSIVSEIGNILSCRLGSMAHPIDDYPFSYGTQDLESVNTSSEDLGAFSTMCRKAILHFEPRLADLEISDIKIDRETQTISLDIICYPKLNELPKFSTILSRNK